MKESICPDCGVNPGESHEIGCDIEVCSVCCGQKLGCACEGHDPLQSKWTGQWPGVEECEKLGYYVYFSDCLGFVSCSKDHLDAVPDLNRLTREKMIAARKLIEKPLPIGRDSMLHMRPSELSYCKSTTGCFGGPGGGPPGGPARKLVT